MTARPCITCGEPTPTGSHCPEHQPHRTHTRSASARGYDAAWQRLSKRARRAQPFCTDCGATTDLTADHSPEAWQRHAAGLPLRLTDVSTVCRSCNGKRGKARPDNDTPKKENPRHAATRLDKPGGMGTMNAPEDRGVSRAQRYTLRGAQL